MAKTESARKLQKGSGAPAFSLPSTHGRATSLEEVRGRDGTLIIFICNHCPYVKARVGELVALHKEFGDHVAVVGINSNDRAHPILFCLTMTSGLPFMAVSSMPSSRMSRCTSGRCAKTS